MFNLSPPSYDDYGLGDVVPGLRESNQFEREIFCYKVLKGEYGKIWCFDNNFDPSRYKLLPITQHMLNAIMLAWPDDVKIKVRGYINTNFIDIIEALCTHDDVGIAGNASSGKSWATACWVICDWLAYPLETTTYVASTTLGGNEDRIWNKIVKLYEAARPCIGSFGKIIGHRYTIVAKDEADTLGIPTASIKALAFPPGNEGLNTVKNCRGRKGERIRVVADELAEMDLYTLDIRVNFAANDDFVFIGIGNPDSRPNPHKELCKPDHPLGWRSVNKDMRTWKTRTGICLFLNGERSPNLQAPENEIRPFPGLLDRKMMKRMLEACYGNINSLQYWRNVIGYWPDSSVELTVVSEQFIESSRLNMEPTWDRRPIEIICGFDPAFTSGGDRCCATFSKLSYDDTGRRVVFYMGTKTYDGERDEVFETAIARQVVDDCIKAGVKPSNFGMDICGDGGKMMQAIIIEWLKYDKNAPNLKAISSSGSPTTRIVSEQDKRKCEDVYDRLVTEYWFAIHTAIGTKSLYGIDVNIHTSLLSELCTRTYYIKNKKTAVETKAEMKARIGKSPDESDSLVLNLEVCRRNGLIFTAPGKRTQEQEEIDAFERRYILNREEASLEAVSYGGDSTDPDGF